MEGKVPTPYSVALPLRLVLLAVAVGVYSVLIITYPTE